MCYLLDVHKMVLNLQYVVTLDGCHAKYSRSMTTNLIGSGHYKEEWSEAKFLHEPKV